MNYYIKQSPITGLAGFGGGASGLVTAGGAPTGTGIWYGNRGLNFGGATFGGTYFNVIEYVDITSVGSNASDFGDLSGIRREVAGCSDGTKALMIAGYPKSSSTYVDYIEWVTVSSTGNSADRGDLTQDNYSGMACSDGLYGFYCGGVHTKSSITMTDKIEVFTMATSGNASDAGDLTSTHNSMGTMVNDATRAVRCGGAEWDAAKVNTMDYFTMLTSVSSSDFGDLSYPSSDNGGCGNASRGVISLGGTLQSGSVTYSPQIDYITIASTGNASDFGDLTITRNHATGCCNATRAIFQTGYGWPANAVYDRIDYIEIDTTANASDFGNTANSRWAARAASGSPS